MPIKATFTGDVTDLRRGTQQAREEFRKVGTEAEGAARQLKAVGSSFDGSKIEGAARRVASGIERIGGAARLTDSEIAKHSRTISEVLQKYERMGVEAPANIRALGAELDKLKQKSASLKDIGPPAAAAKSFGLLQGAVAGVAAAFTSQGLSTIKSVTADVVAMAGGISDLSAKTGLTTTQVQQFGYAAAQTGTSIDTITGAVTQLSNRLVEGGTGTVTAVHRLGLELADLQRMDPGTAFTTIADAIAKVPDPMQQTQLAMELFGKAGAEILPAIKQGMSELGEEASRLGLVIDEDAVQAIDNMGDAWDRMALQAKVAVAGVVGETITDVGRMQTAWAEWRGDSGEAVDSVTERVTVLQAAIRAATFALESWNTLNFNLETLSGSERGANPERDLSSLGTPTSPWRQFGRTAGRDLTAGIAARSAASLTPDVEAERRQWERIEAARVAAFAKSEAAAKKYREELEKLTGQAMVENAAQLARQLEQVGVTNVMPKTLPTFVEQLQEGLERARALGPEFADSARQIEAALRHAVNSPAYRAWFQGTLRNPTIGLGERSNQSGLTGQALTNAITGGLPSSTIADTFDTFDAATRRNSIAGITVDFQKGLPEIKKWNVELRGVAQAFAQLAQIAGPSMSNVTRGLGTAIASVDAAQSLVDTLGQALPGLGLRDAKGNMTGRGKAVSSVLASMTTGAMLGGMTSNQFAAGALGAGGGLATGAMLGATGATLGLSVAVGAASAIYTAQQNRRAQRAAMDQQRQSIIASMGGIDQFRESVERARFDYEYFLTLFNSDDPDTFTDAINRLNTALQEQDGYATRLSKGLQEVARVQGVLSQQQIAQIRNTRPGAPGSEDIIAFAEQQRRQAEGGITAAIAAIDTATVGGTQNMESFQSSVSAVTASLVVLFDTAIRNGDSAVTVLQRLADPIKQLQTLLTNAGQTPGAGFGALSVLTDIATGEQTGPLVALAQGLGQALAGFANTGLLSPELFGELANGIGEAYHQLELLGKGGLEAARLMQPSLQAIWQMIQDNPALRDTLDDTTLALLDFAEQSGLIGEGFRPAIDRMIDALNELITKLDEFIDALNGIPPTVQMPTPVPAPGAPGPGTPAPGTPPPGTPGGGEYEWPLAAGGIVTRPTRAIVGEAGPEAIIPLSRYGRVGAPIQITVVSQIDGYEAARAITRYQPDVYRTYGAA